MRSSPYVVPTPEAAVFALGALPADEESLRGSLVNVIPRLDEAGISAVEALKQTVEVACSELDGKMLARGDLSGAMTRRLPDALGPAPPPLTISLPGSA